MLLVLAVVALGTAGVPAASALPANPWTGQWRVPLAEIPCAASLGVTTDQIFTATQSGSRVTFTMAYGGHSAHITGNVSADNTVVTAGAAPDGWTEDPPTYCFGTGHGTVQLRMAADGLSFTTIAGSTDLGNGITLDGTYVSGGTEPRNAPSTITTPAPTRPQCPGGPWSGQWSGQGSIVFTFIQTGSTLDGTTPVGEVDRGTISGNTARGTFTLPGQAGAGNFLLTLAPDAGTIAVTATGPAGQATTPYTSRFLGCAGGVTGTTPAPAPNLQTTIPNPQTLTNGPTTIVAPGTVSLRSLKRSKCVLVRVASDAPARVLVSIFSGRLSVRLFGQQLVIFAAPARRQVCIPVPFRARTFNVRTPLKVALGYTAGARRQTSGRKPAPVIRPIKLVP